MSIWSWFTGLFGGADDEERPRKRKKKKKKSGDDEAGPKDSLVLMLPELPFLEKLVVERAAAKIFDVEFESGPDATDFVVCEAPIGMVSAAGWMILVNMFDKPYFDDVEAVCKDIPELRSRDLMEKHNAWISCDVMNSPENLKEGERLAMAGRLLAALAPENALLLYLPAAGRLAIYSSEVETALADGNPMAAFEEHNPVPISGIDSEDPRMIAAVEKARRTFPKFVAALANRKPDDSFAVKVPFAYGKDDDGNEQLEFMWLSVTKVDDTHITGRLDNTPAFVTSVREGQLVRVPRSKLNDWLLVRDGKQHGGFTIKLLMENLNPSEDD